MTKTVNNLDTSPLTLADGTVLNVGDLYVKDSFDDPKVARFAGTAKLGSFSTEARVWGSYSQYPDELLWCAQGDVKKFVSVDQLIPQHVRKFLA